MIAIFPGRIPLDDGDAVDVSLTVEGAELRLATPAADIGSWPLVSCRLDELGPGRYRLSVDDDHVDFSPTDPEGFAAFLAGLSGPREGVAPESSPSPGPPAEPGSVVLPEPSGEAVSPAFPERSGASEESPDPREPVASSSPDPGSSPLLDTDPHAPDGGSAAVPDPGGPDDDGIAFEEGTVADAVVEEARRPARLPRAAVWIGAGILLVVAALVVVLGGSGSSGTVPGPEAALADPADAPEPPAPDPAGASGQAPPGEALPSDGPFFSVPAAAAVASWNEVAVPISPSLRVRAVPTPGPFAFALSEAVTFAGTVGADGSLDEVAVVVDGASGVPAVGVQALGAAVAVVEPELDGPDLAAVLASLGFDVAAPVSDGLDAEVSREAATYRLVASGGVVTLTITPS